MAAIGAKLLEQLRDQRPLPSTAQIGWYGKVGSAAAVVACKESSRFSYISG
jgi:hypothetical protein